MSPVIADPADPPTPSEALGRETLYAVIGAIARGPNLERVLPGVIDLLTDATSCHACFIYLIEDGRLEMRAASSQYAHCVGRISMDLDEGLCGWVARNNEPAFIRENAVADPRMKFFEELDEERFQSMIAVPLTVAPQEVIGVVVLHTEAPREFGQDVVDLLANVASVVAGAIHNARLYDEARARAERLSALNQLGQEIAAVAGRDDLYRTACDGATALLEATAARLFLVDQDEDRLEAVFATGTSVDDQGRASLLPCGPGCHELRTRLIAGREELGMLVVEREGGPFGAEDERLLDAVGNQLSVTLQKVDLIERLTGENLTVDLFDALAAGRTAAAEAAARASHHDLSQFVAVVVMIPAASFDGDFAAASAAAAARLRRLVPGVLVDVGVERTRALLPVSRPTRPESVERLDSELLALAVDGRMAVGRSQIRAGLTEGDRGLAEASHAADITDALEPDGGMTAYDDLGAYRYIERGVCDPTPDDRQTKAIAVLAEYDRRHQGALTLTLERYLKTRSGIAQVAAGLHVHPNTLRKRLERIEELTGLDIGSEDPLCLELAIKVARLGGGVGGRPAPAGRRDQAGRPARRTRTRLP
ncbi:MAG: GAF domain-containing protein [Solirubrobacterales bacterium]